MIACNNILYIGHYNTHHFPYSGTLALAKMETKMCKFESLKFITQKLVEKFCRLPAAVKQSLIKHNVRLEDSKLTIRHRLEIKTKTMPKIKECLQDLENVKNYDDLFLFLYNNSFIGYINYTLLMTLSKLTEDQEIIDKLSDYEREYAKLLYAAYCNDLKIFYEYPDHSPDAPIGLPNVYFNLESTKARQLQVLDTTMNKITCPQDRFVRQLQGPCTYAIVQYALDDVKRDPNNLNELKAKGVTVMITECTGILFIIQL